jgi:tetratricopeptide (TPR) repeat protein
MLALLLLGAVLGCSNLGQKIASVSSDSRTEDLRHWERRDDNRKSLLVFVHGFNSARDTAWDQFPSLVREDNGFDDFNILLYGYPTRVCRQPTDVRHAGEGLASYLMSVAPQYDNVVFVSHSMGGLIVLNALLTVHKNDSSYFDRSRVRVLTFGTPHGGVPEASYLELVCENRQAQDMRVLNQPLYDLKESWSRTFGRGTGTKAETDFRRIPVTAFYGMEDRFVPQPSACQGFEQYCFQVDGNHITMVKPRANQDHMAYRKTREVAVSLRQVRPVAMPVVEGKVRVAVLPFENLTDVKPLREGMALSLTDGFLNSNNVVAYNERPILTRLLSERNLTGDSAYGESDVLSIGESIGVDFVIWGAIQKYQWEPFRATVRLVEMKGRKVLRPTFEAASEDVSQLQKLIFNQLIAVLDNGISRAGHQRALDVLAATRNLTAYEHYVKGRNAVVLSTPQGYEQAAKWYEDALRVDPNYSLAWAGLASAYVFWGFERSWNNQAHQELYDRALKAARRAVDLDPSISETHRALALVYAYWLPPRRQEAEEEARKALAINPNDYEAYFAIAKARDGDEAYLLKAIEINPNYVLAYGWLVTRVYLQSGRLDKAIEVGGKILALSPDNAVTYGNLAGIYLMKGQFEAAIENGRRAIKLKPDLQPAHRILGFAYFSQGSYAEGRDALVEAVRLNDRDAEAHAGLATVYELMGLIPDAIRQWERCLTVESSPTAIVEFATERLKELRAK